MKTLSAFLFSGFVCLCAISSTLAQGSFQNLDFESPVEGNLTNGYVAFSDAFPGWSGWIAGTNQAPLAGYNFISGGGALVTLITPTALNGDGADVIGGNYTATITSGEFGPLGNVSAAIAQTGLIPPSSRSLRFSASGAVGFLAVSFNGVSMPFFQVGAGPNYGVYAADLSSLAGASGELRFTEQTSPIGATMRLDDIFFSPVGIPEPSVITLSALGALLLTWRFLRQTRRRP